MNEQESKTVGEKIADRCKAINVPVSELSRRSGVDRQIFFRWKNENPKTISQYKAIEKALAEMEQEAADKITEEQIEILTESLKAAE